MSKTRVFIYGSCVSRDTFEHLDPEQFELVEYVARQSVLSATTRPVESVAPPALESRFQQRMVTGDFQSSLRPLLAQHAAEVDVLLVDLTDERLGVYLLPDGTVVTRSVELIESGAEQTLPPGAQHVAFGTQQHYEYWSGAIRALGDSIRQTAPRAAVALLDIPWAEWSESGQQTPDSFGIGAAQANPVFRSYVEVAVQALGAHVISLEPGEVMSGSHHPWGDAPFHYAEKVYLEAVRRLTGAEGRVVWGPGTSRTMTADLPAQTSTAGTAARQDSTIENKLRGNQLAAVCAALRAELPGGWKKHAVWKNYTSAHDFVAQGITFGFDIYAKDNVFEVNLVVRDSQYLRYLKALLTAGGIPFKEIPDKGDRVFYTRAGMVDEIVDDTVVKKLVTAIKKARRAIEQESRQPVDQLTPAAYLQVSTARAFT